MYVALFNLICLTASYAASSSLALRYVAARKYYSDGNLQGRHVVAGNAQTKWDANFDLWNLNFNVISRRAFK